MPKKKDSWIFNNNWLSDTRFSSWLAISSSKWRANCASFVVEIFVFQLWECRPSAAMLLGNNTVTWWLTKNLVHLLSSSQRKSESHNRAAAGKKTPPSQARQYQIVFQKLKSCGP